MLDIHHCHVRKSGLQYLVDVHVVVSGSMTVQHGHEIGHNMGCAHDRNNAGGSTFSYAYGHRWNGNNGTLYRSTMAYSPWHSPSSML